MSLKTHSFGAGAISTYSPSRDAWDQETKVINMLISFEEALKLNLALDECLRKLNKYKRSSIEGKRAAVNLALHLHVNRIAVLEGKI